MPKKFLLLILVLLLILTMVFYSCDTISNINPRNVATVESILYHMSLVGDSGVNVNIKPTKSAKADTGYAIDLYESGRFRARQTTFWTTDELQTSNIHQIFFALPDQELLSYIQAGKDSNDVFSIKIYEYQPQTESPIPSNTTANSNIPLQNATQSATKPLPTLTLTYPKGGEIWHVGDVVTITWTSENIPKDALINILFETSNVQHRSILESGGIPNTGSYKWTIPVSIKTGSTDAKIADTNARIDVVCNNISTYGNSISGYFTIEEK